MVVLKYNTKTFMHSKIGSKIVIFVFILIILVITSFIIFSYYQSQMTYLGNSINIAGKNRFLTSSLMFEISKYSFIEGNTKNSSKINSAINQLESNILALRQGGGNIIAGIEDLKPLPREFLNDWKKIYQKWISLKNSIANNIIKADDEIITSSEKSKDKGKKAAIETEALSLVDSSNILVTKLSDYLKSNSEHSLFNQRAFIILDIAVIAAFFLYLSRKISKPIISLNSALSEDARETLNLIGQSKDNNNNNDDDELSVLSNSFNYMVNSLKNINKQDEYSKEKINEMHYESLKNEISILYEKIFRNRFNNSLNNNYPSNKKPIENQLSEIRNEIEYTYSEGKLDEIRYTSLVNNISILYQEIFKKEIDSLNSLTNNEDKIKLFNNIRSDIEDAYSKEKVTEKHYNLLKEKISEFENKNKNNERK